MKLYGVKTNANVKKAIKFCEDNAIDCEFVDLKNQNVDPEKINFWLNFCDVKTIFNTHSTKYKELSDKNISDASKIEMMAQDASTIKTPIIEHGLGGEVKITFGFDEDEYNTTFLAK